MKYFVTGATGFVGGRVARQLRAAGHELVALVRAPSKAGDLAMLGVSIAAGDVTNKESMRAAMGGVDGVFHIAGWYKIGVRDTRPGTAINLDVACGAGQLTLPAARKGIQVTGLDLAANLVQQARARAADEGLREGCKR